MKIIDFRFRPNTPEIINGIKNSSMFKATCEAIGFDKRVPQALPEIVADLDRRGVELCVRPLHCWLWAMSTPSRHRATDAALAEDSSARISMISRSLP